MSRHVQGTAHLDGEDELYRSKKRENKMLILRNRGILYAFLIQNNRICKVVREEREEFPIGTIVLGKVLHVAKQFGGAFFALTEKGAKGQTGFLQMEETGCCQPVNRQADGRLLSGDELPVQIVRQAKGNKPPQLTLEYSLAGQFVTIKRGSGHVAYSSKLAQEDKARIERAFEKWKKTALPESAPHKAPQGETENLFDAGKWDIVFRTNAAFVAPEDWQKEIIDLSSQLKDIDQMSQTRTAYSRLYEPEAFYLDFLKDQRLSAIGEIVTDEKEVYETLNAHAYARFFPVRLYEDDRIALAGVYALDTRLRELLSPKVHLKSGAYLMIEQTEALAAVDVNSGKAEKKTEPEEFYFRTNLEAVKEVCYQLSARNLSGIILVDFINMKDRRHIEALTEALREECAKDPVPTRFVDLTKLGLAEITRKKTSRSLQHTLRDWAWKR